MLLTCEAAQRDKWKFLFARTARRPFIFATKHRVCIYLRSAEVFAICFVRLWVSACIASSYMRATGHARVRCVRHRTRTNPTHTPHTGLTGFAIATKRLDGTTRQTATRELRPHTRERERQYIYYICVWCVCKSLTQYVFAVLQPQ